MKCNTYYFFDRGILLGQNNNNIQILPAVGKKDKSGPFLTQEYFSENPKLWEPRFDNAYPNVLYDDKEKLYRLYYTQTVQDKLSENNPPDKRVGVQYYAESSRITATSYAESTDGIHWTKPELNLVEFKGSSKNNILMLYAHGTGVMLDKLETNPDRRYKMVTKLDFPGAKGYMAVSFSPDGIHWKKPIRWPEYDPQGDAHNYVFRDTDGKFKLITRIWKQGLRLSALCESDDFIHWSKPKEILRGLGFESQIYSMPVFKTHHYYVGLASIFHEGSRDMNEFDTVDCEFTYTNDLEHFDFLSYGNPIIKRGKGIWPNGEFDCGCIFAAPPIEIDGKTYIYYMGGNGFHSWFRETSLGRVSFEKDKWGYVSAKNKKEFAELTLVPFHFLGEKVKLIMDMEKDGEISIGLYKGVRDTKAIEGYSEKDMRLKKDNDGNYLLSFKKPFFDLEDLHPTIKIKTKNTKLYALTGDLELISIKYY